MNLALMLCVRDLDRSTAFYVNALGATIESAEDHVVVLNLGGATIYLFTESPPTPDKPNVHLAPPAAAAPQSVVVVLRVADADEAYRRLSARGVEFMTPPTEPPWGGLRCFARDPDGYVLELEQPP